MLILGFEWDRTNEEHIARHGVKPYEAEEVLLSKPFLRKTHSGRYAVFGQSLAGRCLFVVFEPLGAGTIRVITARDMAEKERRFFRRMAR